ncbi:MAG: zf-TFIIB domain-containing protein [Pseudomonadota bacterium]|nr:zf-TFIIB domain-containing protein [Pseudomonadota bacterium]
MSDKTTDPEAEYFARLDAEKKKALHEQVTAEKAASEKEARRQLHHLRCGKCGGQMAPETFRGVTIDVCPDCGSVLLDPGELQQLAGNDESGALASLSKFFTFKR